MSAADLKIIKRGRENVLLLSGRQFYRQRVYKSGKSIWRCTKYKDNKCAGSVTLTVDLREILQSKLHSTECHPNENENMIDIMINNSCEEAASGKEPAPRAFNRGLANIRNKGLDLAVNKPVPDFKNKKSSIYRNRNKIAGVKRICTSIVRDVEVPRQFQSFLLADYYNEPLRIIIFCSEDARGNMKKVRHFFMDGTFKSSPSPFKQILSIHGDIGSNCNQTNIIPLLYAFMSNQTKEAYLTLFSLIKSQIPDWQPNKFTIDFEEAAMRALAKMNVTVKGCQYHFSNSLWRKAKQLGLHKNKLDRRFISLCSKLPFLPVAEIKVGWQYIKSEIAEYNTEQLKEFLIYFEKYWMRDDFINIWCVYGERHRTNNAVEGWHHKINNEINKNEGNILQILHILYNDSLISSFRNHKIQNFPSCSQPKRRRIEIDKDDFIRNAQLKLVTSEIGVGHFIEMIR